MTELQQIKTEHNPDGVDSVNTAITIAYRAGIQTGLEKEREKKRQEKYEVWREAFEAGRDSIDEDKIILKHLIPESGLKHWNKMTPEERMGKMHEIWDWQKRKLIQEGSSSFSQLISVKEN